MNDFRLYPTDSDVLHYGVGHDQGGHSGRYPWGSGKNPNQRSSKEVHTKVERKTVLRSKAIQDRAKASGYKILNKPETIGEAMRKTNPYRNKIGGSNNCFSCSMSGFLRTNGVDAKAKRVISLRGGINALQILDDMVKDNKNHYLDYTYDKGEKPEAILKAVEKDFGKEDGQGLIFVRWDTGGGHVFNWTSKGGKVSYDDYQSGGLTDNYFNHIDTNEDVTVYRLDNAEIDYNKLSKYLQK